VPKDKPKIGIAFGGGGIRGMAHLAVIEELTAAGIYADMVAGTSVGAAMAALYAAGLEDKNLTDLFFNLDLKSLTQLKPQRQSVLSLENYIYLIKLLTKNANIEDLPRLLRIIATDLNGEGKVVFAEGSVAEAVRASSSIPGIFPPVPMGERLLVDGYLVDCVPAGEVKAMGADIVIAVDLSYNDKKVPSTMVNVLLRSIDVLINILQPEVNADVVIRPFQDVSVSALEMEKAADCYKLGQTAVAGALPRIKEVIADYNA